MLDLADGLEVVVDALDEGPLARQQLGGGPQDLRTPVFASLGDAHEPLLHQEKLIRQL